MNSSVWEVLGIDATEDERAIKKAYAGKLKITRPEDDPAAFQQLRQAYAVAISYAQSAKWDAKDEVVDEDKSRNHNNKKWQIEIVPGEPVREPRDFMPVIRKVLRLGETNVDAAVQEIHWLKGEDGFGFVDKEEFENQLISTLATSEPIKPELLLAIGDTLSWSDPDVMRQFYERDFESAAIVLESFLAERGKREWFLRGKEDSATGKALDLLLRPVGKVQKTLISFDAEIMHKVEDLLYLIPASTPEYWRQIESKPSVQYWQEHSGTVLLSYHEMIVSLVVGLIGFLTVTEFRRSLFWGVICGVSLTIGVSAFAWTINSAERILSRRYSHLNGLLSLAAGAIALLAIPFMAKANPDGMEQIPLLLIAGCIVVACLLFSEHWKRLWASFRSNVVDLILVAWWGILFLSTVPGMGRTTKVCIVSIYAALFLMAKSFRGLIDKSDEQKPDSMIKGMMDTLGRDPGYQFITAASWIYMVSTVQFLQYVFSGVLMVLLALLPAPLGVKELIARLMVVVFVVTQFSGIWQLLNISNPMLNYLWATTSVLLIVYGVSRLSGFLSYRLNRAR